MKRKLSIALAIRYIGILLLGTCALLFNSVTYGQTADTYVFSASSGTFTPLSGGTSVSSIVADDANSASISLGFTFNYCGNTYTSVTAGSNGYLTLNASPTTSTYDMRNNDFNTSTGGVHPIIGALWDDLVNTTGTSASYLTTGSPGSQVFTFEWLNYAPYAFPAPPATISFQIKLYEADGKIEYIYRQEAGTTAFPSASIGISSATGVYLSLDNTSANPNASSTTNTTNITSRPATGQVYTFLPPTPCNGQPPVAQTIATVTNACVGSPFSIGVSGLPLASGYTYEFQSSPAGAGTFTSLGPAQSSAVYTISSQSVATDYQVIVTCASMSLSSIALPVSVGQNTYYNCYCTPGSNCTNEGIENVTFSTLNNSSTSCNNTSGYTDYSGMGSLATITQGQQVSMSVTAHINSNPASAGVWIDYDHNGAFDASEYTSLGDATVTIPTGGTTYVFSGNVNTDVNALTGITRMRVRSANQSGITSGSSCVSSGVYGEFEDYLITIDPAPTCTGTPDPVTASSSVSNVCPNVGFTLIATGPSTGTGISYDWEYFDGTNWVSTGNSSFSYTVSGGITAATDYRFVTTCANGGGQDISNTVTVAMEPFYNCYCTSAPQYIYDGEIYNVTVAGLNNTSTCASTGGPGSMINQYSDYTTTVPTTTLMQTVSYPLSVTAGACNGSAYDAWVKVWIDYDHDGQFTGVDEEVFSGTTTSGQYTPAGDIAAGNIVIPGTSLTGITRMRVILWQSNTATPVVPCQNGSPYNYGETEDYLVDIIAPVGCTGQPDPVTASGPADVCQNTNFSLTATGATIGAGISYEWQYFDGTNWTAIANATNVNYTVSGGIASATDYRFVTTCANGGAQDISNTVSVGISPFLSCYCTSAPQYVYDGEIYNVTVAGLNNTSTCASTGGPGSIINKYSDYTATVPATTLMQTVSYPLSVTAGACNGYAYDAWIKVWIDYDHDGQFTGVDEEVFSGTTTSGQYTPAGDIAAGNIIVPNTALTGVTRMRVILWQSNTATPVVPCQNGSPYNYGETEDYLVDIVVPTGCTGQPDPVTASGPANVCPNASFTLTTTGATIGGGITYDWQYFDGTNWVSTGGTNVSYTVSAGINTPTDYRFVTTCTNGGAQDISNTVSISVNPPTQCYCNSSFSNVNYEFVTNVTYGGINNTTTGTTGGPVDYTSQVGNVYQGLASDISVTIDPDANDYVYVFIDWDQNGVLNDAGEVYTLATATSAAGPHILSITPPMAATLGNTRMRVMVDWNNGTPNPCRSATYGEAEDYTINVGLPPSCLPPSNLTATNVTTSSADVSWDPATGAVGYEYVIDQTSAATPTGTSTGTTATSATVTSGIAASMTYYLHVRTDCGGGDYSAWVVYAFSTPPDNDPCANAVDISNALPANGTTTGATQSMASGSCASTTTTANDVWYSFTTTTAGDITVTATNTAGDLVLEVLSGSCGAFTELGCSDGPAIGTESVALTALPAGTYYVRVYGYLSSQTTFVVQATGAPLAIRLTDITAANTGTRNRIDWNTAIENNGDHFIVERSLDARNYNQIGNVMANNKPSSYTFWDQAPVTGINYYRLKMMDATGKFQYSKVVNATVNSNGSFTIEAFPNPVTDLLTINIHGVQGANASIAICDVTGKILTTTTVERNTININMSNLPQGIYLIKYNDANRDETLKVNKQ